MALLIAEHGLHGTLHAMIEACYQYANLEPEHEARWRKAAGALTRIEKEVEKMRL